MDARISNVVMSFVCAQPIQDMRREQGQIRKGCYGVSFRRLSEIRSVSCKPVNGLDYFACSTCSSNEQSSPNFKDSNCIWFENLNIFFCVFFVVVVSHQDKARTLNKEAPSSPVRPTDHIIVHLLKS